MFHSLRTKLIGISVLLTTLALLVLSGMAFTVVRADMLAELDKRLGGLTQQHAAELAQWLVDKQQLTGSIRLALDQENPLPMLQAAEAAGLDLAYFVRADKSHAFVKGRDSSYDGTQRAWYQQAVREGKPILTPAYPDSSTGALVVSLAEPIQQGGQTVAVIASDVALTTVVKKVNAIHPTAQSFGFLVDTQAQTILAHPDSALTLKPVTALNAQLSMDFLQRLSQSGQHAVLERNGQKELLYAAPVAGTHWVLVVAAEQKDALSGLTQLAWVAGIATLLCIIAAGLVMAASVSRLLRRLPLVRNALTDIASGEGDLTRRMDASGHDELSEIAQAFNQFADKIASVLLQIRAAAENVRLASDEIALGNNDLSCRTEQQASSLEETAAAMEQLTATVQQNAANAHQASHLAQQASQTVGTGGAAVQAVVTTMSGIEAASRKIEAIISVIDGIAFQTNILALNAAVEAARAGDQGRGFAVVAAEVRVLAQRSAEAAREIKGLIEASVCEVAQGSSQVQQAGSTMAQVVSSIEQVTTIVAEISSASQEQSSGIAEVGSAVTQMDQSTQQNAALVEQASAAAHSLQQQAHHLAQIVAGFQLPEQAAAMAAAQPAPSSSVRWLR
ncbi:MAG: HAMP domain-containing protein [Comamonas sp.]|nr:HAMP domain-containing protein [Comamonas sp.]